MTSMGKKIQEMAVFIEFIVGSGLAIFFHMVLHNEQAAYMIFGLAILLSLFTYLVRQDIETTKSHLSAQYHRVHEIPFALAQISDAECKVKALELIASTLKSIKILQKGYIPLDEIEFYLEGARLSDQTANQIKAVAPLSSGWLSRGALINYYQANLRAINRGVSITRIFVTSREELADSDVQKALLTQHNDSIDVRIAFRDELPAAIDISGSDTNSSFDFAFYDDKAVTDVFVKTGKYHGRKTCDQVEVAKYQHLYELLEHCAHPVKVVDDRIILAGEEYAMTS